MYAQRESSSKVVKRAVDSLFIMACHGNMIQYDLDPKPAAGISYKENALYYIERLYNLYIIHFFFCVLYLMFAFIYFKEYQRKKFATTLQLNWKSKQRANGHFVGPPIRQISSHHCLCRTHYSVFRSHQRTIRNLTQSRIVG